MADGLDHAAFDQEVSVGQVTQHRVHGDQSGIVDEGLSHGVKPGDVRRFVDSTAQAVLAQASPDWSNCHGRRSQRHNRVVNRIQF